jgi:hypothetical protein
VFLRSNKRTSRHTCRSMRRHGWFSGVGRAAVGLRRADGRNDDHAIIGRCDIPSLSPERNGNLRCGSGQKLQLHEASHAALSRLRLHNIFAGRLAGRFVGTARYLPGVRAFPCARGSSRRLTARGCCLASPSGNAGRQGGSKCHDQDHGSKRFAAHAMFLQTRWRPNGHHRSFELRLVFLQNQRPDYRRPERCRMRFRPDQDARGNTRWKSSSANFCFSS